MMNPWVPMRDPLDLKHIGKLIEEINEAGAAAARCMIQGIGESEPTTGKLNEEWLEDELADVMALTALAKEHFHLDGRRMIERAERKMADLRIWFAMECPK